MNVFLERTDFRKELAECKLVVLKIGSGVLSGPGGADFDSIESLVRQACWLHKRGKKLVVVTSGAVASGVVVTGNKSGSWMRASAAIGQAILTSTYSRFFAEKGIAVAEFLVSSESFGKEKSEFIESIGLALESGVIPILNKNDAACEKEFFYENDSLASRLAIELKADCLVILGSKDGLVASDGSVMGVAENFDELRELDFGGGMGKGGLQAKLDAFQKACEAGVNCVFANGRENEILEKIFFGQNVGTVFPRRDVEGLVEKCKKASLILRNLGEEEREKVLLSVASKIEENSESILEANELDFRLASEKFGKNSPFLQRLKLGESSLKSLAGGVRKVAKLDLGLRDENLVFENGLRVSRVREALGVVLLVFESRPDVCIEASSLALKSGNSIILKGGKEARNTVSVIAETIRSALREFNLEDCVTVFSGSRDELASLMRLEKGVDLVIPRGGNELIEFVRKNSVAPVIFAGGGNCHLFVNEDADERMALEILFNVKLQKQSACNAVEKLLVHEGIAKSFLEAAGKALSENGVEMRCCEESLKALEKFGAKLAEAGDWGTEFLGPVIGVKIVSSLDEAIDWINSFGTGHSEAIITSRESDAKNFMNGVDAAAVYWNASTRFTDGGQMGFGGELCISTQKLHARGPVSARDLFTWKYKIIGHGQVRA